MGLIKYALEMRDDRGRCEVCLDSTILKELLVVKLIQRDWHVSELREDRGRCEVFLDTSYIIQFLPVFRII